MQQLCWLRSFVKYPLHSTYLSLIQDVVYITDNIFLHFLLFKSKISIMNLDSIWFDEILSIMKSSMI